MRGCQAGPRAQAAGKVIGIFFLDTSVWSFPRSTSTLDVTLLAPLGTSVRQVLWPYMHARACVRLQAPDTCSWLACQGKMACGRCSTSQSCVPLGAVRACVHVFMRRYLGGLGYYCEGCQYCDHGWAANIWDFRMRGEYPYPGQVFHRILHHVPCHMEIY